MKGITAGEGRLQVTEIRDLEMERASKRQRRGL